MHHPASRVRRIHLPRTPVNKGPGPVGGGPGRTFRALGCNVGRLSCAGHDQAEGLVRRLPPGDRVYDDCLIIPRLPHGRQAHARTQGSLWRVPCRCCCSARR